MEQQEVIEGNKLIAEFWGVKFYPKWRSDVYPVPKPTWDFEDNRPDEFSSRYWGDKQLRYSSEWNWLMPVFKKIIDTYPNPNEDAYGLMNEIALSIAVVDIEGAWKGVVAFIKYYNSIQSK